MGILTLEERWDNHLSDRIQSLQQIGRPLKSDTLEILKYNHHLWLFFMFPGEDEFREPLGKADAPVASAFIYRGRWMTTCPFCYSAQDASPLDQWFFCTNCKNSDADNQSVPVEWPDNREEIEATLMLRPFMHTRNWTPVETVADLVEENQKHMRS